jgi:TPR repeat protein
MYAEGLGVAQDYLEAVRWTRLAVEQGNPRAQNNLGASYAFGFGVPQDDAEAVRWYRLSAEQRQECTFQIELREMGIWSHS